MNSIRSLLPPRLAAIVIALAFTSLLGGCARLGLDDGESPVEVNELRHIGVCNSVSGAAAVTLFPDLDTVRAWQQSRGVDLIGDGPLPKGPYAVIEHGARNTGGYAVVVGHKAVVRGGLLLMQASFFAPTSGQLMAEMLTSPCALAQLPVGNYDSILLVDPRGRRRALSSAPPPPSPASVPPAQ